MEPQRIVDSTGCFHFSLTGKLTSYEPLSKFSFLHAFLDGDLVGNKESHLVQPCPLSIQRRKSPVLGMNNLGHRRCSQWNQSVGIDGDGMSGDRCYVDKYGSDYS